MGRATEAIVYVTSGRKLRADVLSRFAYLSETELAALDRARRRQLDARDGGAASAPRRAGEDEAPSPS